ncbi:L-serine ammonia-lyase, iron-sulfur-dependent, subunit alpha [Anaeroselena agilis]|uniref:L-serine dehydratase n=1 Tax=Anaeroselena agilis TaxID=3063788 RepID=A0ABU3P233_9FIRM|nr:L-serine ammonia-lyase, iron-sulfur-dependent, subunit alpha [Selenomonadales bacterium 4137-cl]
MSSIRSFGEWIRRAETAGTTLAAVITEQESRHAQRPAAAIRADMARNWRVMREAIAAGLASGEKSPSGLVGGDARLCHARLESGKALTGEIAGRAIAYALAVSEVNACMGRIVAFPTAGSCGIMPGAVAAAAETRGYSEDAIVDGLLTAAGAGLIIAENASISGAEAGCQAECGAGGAMAAAAIVQMDGGSPRQIGMAVALALKNALGLVCDPVAGLVEVPCVRRNAFYAVQALVAADMALAGVESAIPVDEVVDTMRRVGVAMPVSLRETSQGGLARTPTGLAIERRLHDKE